MRKWEMAERKEEEGRRIKREGDKNGKLKVMPVFNQSALCEDV